MRNRVICVGIVCGLGLSGCTSVNSAYSQAQTPEQCEEAAKGAKFAGFTSSSNPGAALAATLLSAGVTAAAVQDAKAKCLERVSGANASYGTSPFDRDDYVPELASPEAAPSIYTNCTSVMTGGSGYCIKGR